MRIHKQGVLACSLVLYAMAAGAQAPGVLPPTPAGDASAQPVYDPAQLPTFRGRVQQFTLTPRGDIDGLILADGTEVKTPPHLSTAIAYSVKPGDEVVIHGLHAAALPLIQAVSIADQQSRRSVIDVGPPGPPGPPPGPPGPQGAPPPGAIAPMPPGSAANPQPPGLTEVAGRIRMTLHGPQGEINGALLEDGTVLRVPPPAALNLATWLQAGQTVVAEGFELRSALGTVMDVREIGPSRAQLNWVAGPPAPRDDKGPGPRRG